MSAKLLIAVAIPAGLALAFCVVVEDPPGNRRIIPFWDY